MAGTVVAPYGSWKSPITSDLIVSETIRLGAASFDGDDIYWIEVRPIEQGRYVLVRRSPDGSIIDSVPSPFNVRTKVHEYGGGAYTASGGTIYFSNFADQRIYRQAPGTGPHPLTPPGEYRYADYVIDSRRDRLICVREDHTASEREAVNTLVSIPIQGQPVLEKSIEILVSGNDFYSNPHLNPEGTQLAWLTWNHPNMPWDGTELWVGKLDARGSLEDCHLIAGGL